MLRFFLLLLLLLLFLFSFSSCTPHDDDPAAALLNQPSIDEEGRLPPGFLVGDVTAVVRDEPWDVDGPCQKYVELLGEAVSRMVMCAANFTIPPKVCTNCVELYINYSQTDYDTRNLNSSVQARDGTPCSTAIYNNYVISYISVLADAINNRIWSQSSCESCLEITWDFTHNRSYYNYTSHTVDLMAKMEDFRKCIGNYTQEWLDGDTLIVQTNATAVCNYCRDVYDGLYKYYFYIYVTPGIQFCVDVDSTMNDTVHLWEKVWKCPVSNTKRDDNFVKISAGLFALLTVFFYSASYIQGGGEIRRFIQYSRIEVARHPHTARARLISTSASDTNLSSRASSGSTRLPPRAVPPVSGPRSTHPPPIHGQGSRTGGPGRGSLAPRPSRGSYVREVTLTDEVFPN